MHMFMLYTYAHIACYGVQSKVFFYLFLFHMCFFPSRTITVAGFRDFFEGTFCTYMFIYLCVDVCVYENESVLCIFTDDPWIFLLNCIARDGPLSVYLEELTFSTCRVA